MMIGPWNRPVQGLLAAVAMLAGGWGGALVADEVEFNPRRVVKAFEAIREPKSVGLAEADGFVRDEELVLGVVVKGEARAYPLNMLTNPSREIINDKLGGRAIAATW